GKLATFWRSPVNRLKRVDLPEFGGPTIATICDGAARPFTGGAVNTAQPLHPWQSLINRSGRCWTSESSGARFQAATPPPTHPPGRRADRHLVRFSPWSLYVPAKSPTPSIVWRHLPEGPAGLKCPLRLF